GSVSDVRARPTHAAASDRAPRPPLRVAVLVSGSGTILEAMVDAGVPVAVVLADRPCRGLDVARAAGIPAVLVDRRARGGYGPAFDRTGYTADVAAALAAHAPDLVAMAGFGTVLDQPVHDAFPGRVLNTHPALLPAFPGWHAVADALAAGAPVTGCTVHVATLEMDAGPVLAQEEVPVAADDTEEALHERIKRVERRLYPATVLRALEELAAVGSLDRLAAPVPAGAGAVPSRSGASAAPAGAGAARAS
ncbi:MAG: phosphoribosylglycinamide formyltransferase, partial [Acidimicrobiales bacterium]